MRPCDIVEDIKKEAHQRYGKEYKHDSATNLAHPLIPITIFVSSDNTVVGEVSEVRSDAFSCDLSLARFLI
jgi:hypothetical protein